MGLDRCTDSFKIGRDKSINTLGKTVEIVAR